MVIHFAASKSIISKANKHNKEKTLKLLSQICQSTLKTIENDGLPGGVEERDEVKNNLYDIAEPQLVGFLDAQ